MCKTKKKKKIQKLGQIYEAFYDLGVDASKNIHGIHWRIEDQRASPHTWLSAVFSKEKGKSCCFVGSIDVIIFYSESLKMQPGTNLINT